MQANTVLIGADPELFVKKGNQISSAIGLIGGTKEEPLPTEFGALQEDNVLLEFNIRPAHNLEEFRHHIKAVLKDAENSLTKFQMELVSNMSSHIYKVEELDSFGEAAWVFGCDPDFNAWTGGRNEMPIGEVDPGLRTAGGHLHIGYSHLEGGEADRGKNREIIQMCDYLLGIPSLLLDTDDRRRQLYGKAGAYRSKSYGCEYRTLSNFWLFSDELMAWAYQGAKQAYERLPELEAFSRIVSGTKVQEIINTGDKKAAETVCKQLGLAYA